MSNSTPVTIFFFADYEATGTNMYVYLTATLLAYLSIIFVNMLLITVITRERKLHEPMYIFICCLSLNGLYGSSAFYPECMTNLLSETPSISRIGCFIQLFVIHTYIGFEYSILALMAYDRYVSICHPLRYNSIMTPSKVTQLLLIVYLYPVCIFCIDFALIVQLPLCGSLIEKVYCDNFSVIKLSCVDSSFNNGFGLFVSTVFIAPPFLVIFYSYIRILTVCLKASKEARFKALETCTPHLLTFMNYCIATCFEFVHKQFDLSNIPNIVCVVMSIDVLLFPPLFNPIIYGIKMQEIRKRILKIHSSRKNYAVERTVKNEQNVVCLSHSV
nr:PREDICTED: olfactory receptor 51E1-like [Lepisosteus oculatus]